jgi:putative two-component system response regulator
VDDEPYIGQLLSRWLKAEGYDCVTVQSGERAVELLESSEFHLVVSDIMMPGMSGLDLLTFIGTRHPDIAAIMVTAVDERSTATLALDLGAYGYVIKPFDKNEIIINVANAVERRRLTLLSRQYERELEEQVQQRTAQVRRREEEIIYRLVSATGCRDDETGSHVKRIGLYASLMARALGWGPQAVNDIRLAAPMHDVGKIGIPDRILHKAGKLTRQEFEIMKTHAEIGARILDGSEVAMLQMAAEIAWTHHEKWNGAGYPRGLAGEAIPESGRIVAIADFYDALVNDRVYRPALPEEIILSMMDGGKSIHFDARILDCFFSLHREIRAIREEVEEETERKIVKVV